MKRSQGQSATEESADKIVVQVATWTEGSLTGNSIMLDFLADTRLEIDFPTTPELRYPHPRLATYTT